MGMSHLCNVNVSKVIIISIYLTKKKIMAIRFKRVSRLSDPTNQDSVKRTYPIISYKYDIPATLKEVAQEISGNSGVSEGETISVLKDFRTLMRKILLGGRSVNIDGIGYFYLSAQSKGTDKAEDFTASDITGLRICFRANKDIRLNAGASSTRTDGLMFKDLDRLNDEGTDAPSGGDGEGEDPAA